VHATPQLAAGPSADRRFSRSMRLLTIASRRFAPATQRTVVLLSHEWHGIPDEHVDAADLCVEIPMVGRGASLNVAVAGSLVLYRLAGMS
jgi:tRNA G18 (ribose-2'-O)-methylase SpoU